MRLLHCISSLNPAGGGPIEALRLRIGALAGHGVESEVASLDDPAAPWLRDFPATVHALGPVGFGAYGYSSRWVPWLRKNHYRFDAVIINGLWQYNGFGSRRALPDGFPYFVFPHGMLDPWFKRTYPLKHLKKWLYWPWAEYRVLRDARAVFFTSEEERIQARKSFWLYRCEEQVVNYGTAGPSGNLAEHRAAFQAAFPAMQGRRILLYLGRLHEKKGVDLLIRAWASVLQDRRQTTEDGLPIGSLNLVIAGPGDEGYVSGIRRLVEQLGVADSVHLTGMLTGSVKWGALASAEAFILPSHQENFGVAVAEALACGTPVLISNRVNIWREIVADGAGLADTDNLAGTENLIRSWRAEEGKRWTARRPAARACFERRFTIAASADSLIREITRRLA